MKTQFSIQHTMLVDFPQQMNLPINIIALYFGRISNSHKTFLLTTYSYVILEATLDTVHNTHDYPE